MKKLIAILIVFTMLFSFAGCTSAKPDKTVSGMLEAIKSWDTAAMGGFIDINQLYADANVASENQDQMTDILKLITQNLSYQILNTKVDGDSAVVTVSITNTDMSAAMSEYMLNIFALAFSGNYATEAELETAAYDLLKTSIQNNKSKTVTNQVDVQLTKQDKDWVVTMSDELTDAIFGGMITAANNLSSSFN